MRPEIRRRTRWLTRRRRTGQARPNPLRIRAANIASVSFTPERSTRVWERALEEAGKFGRPHIIGACELADVHAEAVAGEAWQVIQNGATGSPDAALGIAVRRDRGRIRTSRLTDGTEATTEGGGIRRRPILRATVGIDGGTEQAWIPEVLVAHAPPGRAPKARAKYLRRLVPGPNEIVLADLNIAHRAVLRLLGRRVHSAGVLHVVVPRWIPSTSTTVEVGSDHLALDVTLWPTPKKEQP